MRDNVSKITVIIPRVSGYICLGIFSHSMYRNIMVLLYSLCVIISLFRSTSLNLIHFILDQTSIFLDTERDGLDNGLVVINPVFRFRLKKRKMRSVVLSPTSN